MLMTDKASASPTDLPPVLLFTGADSTTGALKAMLRQTDFLTNREVLVAIADDWRESRLPLPTDVIALPITRPVRTTPKMLGYPFRLLYSGCALASLVRKRRVGAVAINDFYFLEGVILRLFGYRGRIVTWVRCDPRRFGRLGIVLLSLANWASDELIAVSEYICSTLPSSIRPKVIYDVMPMPPRAVQPSGQRLIFLGNYVEGKGQDDAIAAFHQIAGLFPEATLHFHGGDLGLQRNRRYRRRLQAQARSGPGCGRIKIGGFVEDVSTEFNGALAALNCSSSESFSLTCYEASAHGLPVIATRCGGPEEIIEDGVTGRLVPIGDVAAIADAMAEFLASPEKAQRMGAAGHSRIRARFSADRFRSDLHDVLGNDRTGDIQE